LSRDEGVSIENAGTASNHCELCDIGHVQVFPIQLGDVPEGKWHWVIKMAIIRDGTNESSEH
jgi:hypothetical protein